MRCYLVTVMGSLYILKTEHSIHVIHDKRVGYIRDLSLRSRCLPSLDYIIIKYLNPMCNDPPTGTHKYVDVVYTIQTKTPNVYTV